MIYGTIVSDHNRVKNIYWQKSLVQTKKAEHSISDSSSANVVAHEPVYLSKPQDKQKKVCKQALSSKSTYLSNGSLEIISGSIETKKESDPLALAPLASESSPNLPLIILQESKDVMELIKKSIIEMEKVRAKGRELKSKLTADT
ncbi:1222_t:CDS:1 [Funneliformis geosporum]|nr:1222_t:CDS:1 [Funneliformis geosporum]